jgi:Ca2+-binding RTX toxin-like protein
VTLARRPRRRLASDAIVVNRWWLARSRSSSSTATPARTARWYAGGTAGIDAGPSRSAAAATCSRSACRSPTPGDDVIDAEALFDGRTPGALPSLGITAYGGAGVDIIRGTQAGDMLLGGSGDDLIFGDAGPDRIWGDFGLIVGVIDSDPHTSSPPTPASTSAPTTSVAGTDILFGEGAGNDQGDPGRLRRHHLRRPRQSSTRPASARPEPTNGAPDHLHGDARRRRAARRRRHRSSSTPATGDNIVIGDHGAVAADDVFTTDPGAR